MDMQITADEFGNALAGLSEETSLGINYFKIEGVGVMLCTASMGVELYAIGLELGVKIGLLIAEERRVKETEDDRLAQLRREREEADKPKEEKRCL